MNDEVFFINENSMNMVGSRYKEEIFDMLTQTPRNGYILISKDSQIKYISPNLYDLLGVTQDDIYEYFLKNYTIERLIHLASLNDYHGKMLYTNKQTNESFYLIDSYYLKGDDILVMLTKGMNSKCFDEIIYGVSHDLKTPMNSIIGFSNLLMSYIDDKDKASEYIQKIQVSSNYMLGLVNEILSIASTENNKNKIIEFNINNLVDDIKIILSSLIENKNHFFTIKRNIINQNFIGEYLHIKQVIINVLSNAIKYTQNGGLIELVIDEVAAFSNKSILKFTISDNGVGMSNEFVSKIFDSFARESQTVEGTGIGMTITKQIVENIGGSIEVKSSLGRGTTVTIDLPLNHAIDRLSKDDSLLELDEPESINCLIVDDDSLNAEILSEFLELKDINSFSIANPLDALELLNSNPDRYDLVFMDINMPSINGYEATRRIRNLKNDKLRYIPIIGMTATGASTDISNALACGMNGHISKPIMIDDVIKEINRVLKF